MITEHALPKSLCRRGQPLRVLIVGAGRNGSAVLLGLPYLHQAMRVWGHAGGLHVMLADGDLVSETNCVRQPFASADVGLNKAVVLINRVNLFWGLRWQAHPPCCDREWSSVVLVMARDYEEHVIYFGHR